MPRGDAREPRVDVRRHELKDGTVREYVGVRFYDAQGVCRRVTCASRPEAELLRAQMVVEAAAQRPGQADGSGTLGDFFPVSLADAKERLEEGTVEAYSYWWHRRVEPRFGDVPMGEITPRAVAQWRASMAAEGVGPSSVRESMFLLQANRPCPAGGSRDRRPDASTAPWTSSHHSHRTWRGGSRTRTSTVPSPRSSRAATAPGGRPTTGTTGATATSTASRSSSGSGRRGPTTCVTPSSRCSSANSAAPSWRLPTSSATHPTSR